MTIIEVQTINEFIAELREEVSRIADKTVRYRISNAPLDEELITSEVDFWATALRKGGDEDFLLEFGCRAGCDDSQAEGETQAGTKHAEALHKLLAEACDDLLLKLRPGKIEVF